MATNKLKCPYCHVMAPAAPGATRIDCRGCPAVLFVKSGKIQWSSANGQRAATSLPGAPTVSAAPTPRPVPAPATRAPLANEAPTQDGVSRADLSLSTGVGARLRDISQAVFHKLRACRQWVTTIIQTTPPRYFKLAGAIGGGVLLLFILLAFLLSSDKKIHTLDEQAQPVARTETVDRPATSVTRAAALTENDERDDVEDDIGDWVESSAAEESEVATVDDPRERVVRKDRTSRKSRRRSRRSRRRQRKLASGPTPIRKRSRGLTEAEQDLLSRARKIYKRANRRLFAGEARKAIRGYRLALKEYPRFVASYRGLGLAYMQQGKNRKALRALRTYVRYARKAADVPLINKRIRRLRRRR